MFWQHGQLYFLMLATRKTLAQKLHRAKRLDVVVVRRTDARADISGIAPASARTRAAIAGHHEAVPLPAIAPPQQLAPTNAARAPPQFQKWRDAASAVVIGGTTGAAAASALRPATGVVIAQGLVDGAQGCGATREELLRMT